MGVGVCEARGAGGAAGVGADVVPRRGELGSGETIAGSMLVLDKRLGLGVVITDVGDGEPEIAAISERSGALLEPTNAAVAPTSTMASRRPRRARGSEDGSLTGLTLEGCFGGRQAARIYRTGAGGPQGHPERRAVDCPGPATGK
jgi:hypothetical protein